ncbi:MAG TPA: DUF539 domain-containing protein [Methylococcus sp.]|nr:DUF539 domain-containing protein [Methylococcus sp.]
MTLFLITFAIIGLVVLLMAVGVIFGRPAIRGTCGGLNGGDCLCAQKCDKRLKPEAGSEA